MIVLLLGATGFVGTASAVELATRGHRVVGVGRSTGGTGPAGGSATAAAAAHAAAVVPRTAGGTPSAVDDGPTERSAALTLTADLLVPGAVERLLDETGAAGVINLAAVPDIAPCRRDPAAARRLNAHLPGELAAACARRGARLVHVSTDQVFDGTRGHWREDDPARPLHVYGETKLAGERAVLDADPSAAVVRPALVTGPAPPGRRSSTSALLAALARGERPGMFTDEVRSPIAVGDLARALCALLERGDAGGLFHCGGPEALSRHELACREARAAGFDVARVGRGTRAEAGLEHERPADLSLDSSRLVALLGWMPSVLAPA